MGGWVSGWGWGGLLIHCTVLGAGNNSRRGRQKPMATLHSSNIMRDREGQKSEKEKKRTETRALRAEVGGPQRTLNRIAKGKKRGFDCRRPSNQLPHKNPPAATITAPYHNNDEHECHSSTAIFSIDSPHIGFDALSLGFSCLVSPNFNRLSIAFHWVAYLFVYLFISQVLPIFLLGYFGFYED